MPLDDADIADVLGGFLDKIRRELRRDMETLALESRAALAELRAEAATLHGELRERIALVKDGAPGLDGRDGMDGPQGAQGPPGERGEPGEAITGPPGEQGIQGPPGAAGSDGLDGRDGIDGAGIADAFVGRDGELVLTFTDGRVKNLGAGFAKDINAEAIAVIVSNAVADMYKKIWTSRAYKRGDWVTHGGSLFVAVADTAETDRPMDSEVWTLALRRGRDGKDAPPAKAPRPSLALPEPAK